MRNLFKKPTPEQLRANFLAEHERRLLAAEIHYAHAKANLEMEREIVTRMLDKTVKVGAGVTHFSAVIHGGGGGGGKL